MSSPGACFGVSLSGGNGDYRVCWQLNTSRIGPCCIFINSGTVLSGHTGQRNFKYHMHIDLAANWFVLNGAKMVPLESEGLC